MALCDGVICSKTSKGSKQTQILISAFHYPYHSVCAKLLKSVLGERIVSHSKFPTFPRVLCCIYKQCIEKCLNFNIHIQIFHPSVEQLYCLTDSCTKLSKCVKMVNMPCTSFSCDWSPLSCVVWGALGSCLKSISVSVLTVFTFWQNLSCAVNSLK